MAWSQKFRLTFSPQQRRVSFPLTQSKSAPGPNFEVIYSPDPIQIQQNLL